MLVKGWVNSFIGKISWNKKGIFVKRLHSSNVVSSSVSLPLPIHLCSSFRVYSTSKKMEELPRIIFGGAKLFLRGAFGAEIHSHQGTPPSRNSDNNKPPSRRSSSSTITGESAGQGSNDGVNSSKRNTPHKKSCKYGEKEESPQQAAFQAQLSPLIDAFIPKSFLMRILYLICWPITLFCFFYIYLPMKLWEYIQSLHVYKVSLQISLRKNELIR